MAGNLRRPGNPVYYICWPKASHRGPEDKLTKHPKTVRIREDVLLGTLLEALSKLHFKLDQAPEALQRRLYEIAQLTVHVDHETQKVQTMIKIPATNLDQVADAAGVVVGTSAPRTVAVQPLHCVDAVRAPGRIRTCATASGGRCSIP